MKTGKAIKVDRIDVECICGFNGKAGYQVCANGEATISFIPKTSKVHKLTELTVGGRRAIILSVTPSLYIAGMHTFLIKYEE